MSFAELESSRDKGEPISLFLIRYGQSAQNYYAYTNHEQEITYANIVYKPINISHGAIRRSVSLDNARIVLRTPSEIELAARWRSYPPSEVISLTIRRGHVGSNDFKVTWLGRLLSHKDLQDGGSEFDCEPRTTGMLRSSLNRNYQYGCPHVLHSQGPGLCNADKEAATTEVLIEGVNGPMVDLVSYVTNVGMEDYVTGMLEWMTEDNRYEVRTILRIKDNGTLVLGGKAVDLAPGMAAKLVKGCNHLTDGCAKHNNSPNYGGQPFIPLVNPIGVKNSFY